jgi:hypothetical protein
MTNSPAKASKHPIPRAAQWRIAIGISAIAVIVAFFSVFGKDNEALWMTVVNVVAGSITALGAVIVALWPDSTSEQKYERRLNFIGRCALAGGAIYLAVALWAFLL